MSEYESKYMDEEEKALVEDIEGLDVKKMKPPSKSEQRKIRAAARQHVARETKMNIRIDPRQLDKIKAQAQKEGLKYQTLVKSVMHKYLTGQLVEKK